MGPSLNRVIIFVGNVRACASFYRDSFGFQPLGDWTDEWAEIDANGCRLAFHQAYGSTGTLTEPTGSEMNPHKIVFTVSDVDQMRQSLVAKGVRMGEVQRYPDWNDLTLCDGVDVEGHPFQLCNQ